MEKTLKDFVTFIYPDRSPCILKRSRIKKLKELPGGRTLVTYDNGNEYEVLVDISTVRMEVYGYEES